MASTLIEDDANGATMASTEQLHDPFSVLLSFARLDCLYFSVYVCMC